MRILLILGLGLAGFGQEWTVLISGVSARLRGVSAVNERVAWASGAEGTVLRTADGGTTWKRLIVPGAEKLDFRDVDAVDEKTAYVLSIGPGGASRIYKTRDAGMSWAMQFQNTDEKAFFDAMTFWDARHGMAVGDSIAGRFVFLFTADGGAHWERREVPGALAGEGAFAASGTNIASWGRKLLWVGTTAGRVLRSSDGGRTWAISSAGLETGASAGIFSVVFRDGRHGVVVGGDYKLEDRAERNVAVTEDGGVTWKLGTGMGGLRSVVSVMGKGLVAVGPTGTDVSVDGGATWRGVKGLGLHTFSVGKGGVVGFGAGEKGLIGRLRW